MTLSADAISAARQAAYDDARYEYERALADAARDEAHERHGAREHPEPDDCSICADEAEDAVLWGGGA